MIPERPEDELSAEAIRDALQAYVKAGYDFHQRHSTRLTCHGCGRDYFCTGTRPPPFRCVWCLEMERRRTWRQV